MTNAGTLENNRTESERMDRRRRKREAILIVVIPVLVAVLTFVENRTVQFGSDLPVSNTILMFLMININLLLLILLIYLVFRNLVKLFYDRRRKMAGAKLRTRLVVSFVALTLLPTTVLFFFSINFITNSIEFWFNAPVEQALENSLKVGRLLYSHMEENNRFFLERISYQVEIKGLLDEEKADELARYLKAAQQAFNLHSVEVYSSNANRLASAALENGPAPVSANNLQKETGPKGTRSISERTEQGELYRTIGATPFLAKQDDAEGYVAVSILIPPDLAGDMQSISDGFQEYQQIKLLKRPIQITYYITLSIVALLVVFCAVWFGLYLAKTISVPIMELSEGTKRVAEGDLNVAIDMVADDEIGDLVHSFNRMTKDLRVGRQQLELSARMLQQRNEEIEERRRFMEIVLKNVSTGVITIDAAGVITSVNKSAERMLSLESERLVNGSFKRLLKGRDKSIAKQVLEDLANARNNMVEASLRIAVDGKPRSFLVNISVLDDDSGQRIGYVMVFDDLTELEKAQRMAAWREVARRIAHEVKNPLTPIALSAERLRRKFAEKLEDPVFEECTRLIIEQSSNIRNLVNEFSSFAKFPTANPTLTELGPILEETLALYRDGYPDISFVSEIEKGIPLLNLDTQQMKQAMINLVDNAIAAIREKGHIRVTATHDPILKRVRIEVADDGAGISDLDKTRLFEPNFSTKKSGMGLGLTIVSSIVADHDGLVSVQNNKPRGAKFVIELPIQGV